MGQLDWEKLTSGAGTIVDGRQENVTVPDDQLAHDLYCRSFSGDRGHWFFKYISEQYTLIQDLSIRAAFSIKKTDALVHMAGIGLRMDDDVTVTPVSGDIIDQFTPNGYQLLILDDHTLNLYRLLNGTSTKLYEQPLLGGTNGQYKWFHIRLDFLLQSDGRAVVQVFTNDLNYHQITTPDWLKVSPNILENRSGIPQTDKIGIGGLITPGESTFVDRVEIYKS